MTASAPLPPVSVSVLANETSASAVTLQWLYDRSATYVESWEVKYRNQTGSEQITLVPSSSSTDMVEYKVQGLVAGFKYNMSVRPVVMGTFGAEVYILAVTSMLKR